MNSEDLRKIYKRVYKDFHDMGEETLMKIITIRILIHKIKDKYNLRTLQDVSTLIGLSVRQLGRIINVEGNIPKYLIPTLCFYLGFTLEDILADGERKDINMYVSSVGELIVNGVVLDKFKGEW